MRTAKPTLTPAQEKLARYLISSGFVSEARIQLLKRLAFWGPQNGRVLTDDFEADLLFLQKHGYVYVDIVTPERALETGWPRWAVTILDNGRALIRLWDEMKEEGE